MSEYPRSDTDRLTAAAAAVDAAVGTVQELCATTVVSLQVTVTDARVGRTARWSNNV